MMRSLINPPSYTLLSDTSSILSFCSLAIVSHFKRNLWNSFIISASLSCLVKLPVYSSCFRISSFPFQNSFKQRSSKTVSPLIYPETKNESSSCRLDPTTEAPIAIVSKSFVDPDRSISKANTSGIYRLYFIV